jgi:RNA polymerase sigma-70 factor (ECF subfamily)
VTVIVERREAFESFYRRERDGILRAVVYALNDPDLAVECIDEAMVRAYERWDDLDGGPNPAGWVFRVAVNLGHNRFRRRRLERTKPPPGDRTVPETDVPDPALHRALVALPVDQRAVVVMRFHLDWTMEQMAEALGVAVGTVKSRLHRGLRRLETLLEEETA